MLIGILTVSETARNYCKQCKVKGAELKDKTWIIPEDAEKQERAGRKTN